MTTIKRGATLKVTIELTEEEWAAFHPWDSIRAEAQQGPQGPVEHEMTLTHDLQNRTILLILETQPLALGKWQFDVRAEKSSGESVFLPPDRQLEFAVIEGITE